MTGGFVILFFCCFWGILFLLFHVLVFRIYTLQFYNSFIINRLSMAYQRESDTVEDQKLMIHDLVNYRLYQEVIQRISREKSILSEKSKAERADQLKTMFLTNMSHEFRAPMNGILGFAQLLANENLPPEMRKKYADIICDNGKMLLNIVNDVLDISKIEKGKLHVQKSLCNIDNIISRLHDTYQVNKCLRNRSGINIIKITVTGETPLMLVTDPYRFEQILSNLLDNALKFTKEGYIEFGYLSGGNTHVTFYVRDTGIGMCPETREVLFERFSQGKNISNINNGCGLGLAICKGLVEQMGGKIWFESEEKKGTVFYFKLPRVDIQTNNSRSIHQHEN